MATPAPAFDTGPAVLFGAFDPADWQQSNNAITAGIYAAIDQLTGQPMSMTHPQLSWANGTNPDGTPKYQRLYTPRLDADRAAGRISVLTCMSFNLANPADVSFSNEAILAGKHDAWIDQFATDAAAYRHPFIARLNPEMNGWWEGPFSEFDSVGNLANGNTFGSYVRAWRYVVGKVKPIAPNVKWFWCCNPVAASSASSPSTPPIGGYATAPNMLAHFYPGDDVVDFVGCDLYNYGAAKGMPWLTFRQCLEGDGHSYGNTLAAIMAVAPGKPWLIGEVGCHDAPGDKAAWVMDMLQTLPQRYPMIRGLLWFNWNAGANFSITAGATAQAFATGLADPHWLKAATFPLDGAPYVLATTPDKDTEIGTLTLQLAAAQQQLAAANQQVTNVTNQVTTETAQVGTDATTIKTLQSELATAQSKLGQYQQATSQLTGGLDALRAIGVTS